MNGSTCGRTCAILRSNSERNPGRLYFSCADHGFVIWCDKVEAVPDAARSAGPTGYQVREDAMTIQPGPAQLVSHRLSNAAAEGPQFDIMEPSPGAMMGAIMNLRLEVEHARADTSAKLDRILAWMAAIEHATQ